MKKIGFAVLAVLAGCGAGGGGGIPNVDVGAGFTPFPVASVSVGDAPVDSLDYFNVVITKCAMVNGAGADVVVYPGPGAPPGSSVTVNLLSHSFLRQLVGSAGVPAGSYVGIRIEVAAAWCAAQGVVQTIVVEGGGSFPLTVLGYFDAPAALSNGGGGHFVCDFDLSLSLADGGGSVVIFRPVVLIRRVFEPVPVDYFHGTIVSIQSVSSSVVIQTETGATIQVNISATSIVHGLGWWVFGFLAFLYFQIGDVFHCEGWLDDGGLDLDCGELEDENDPTFQFRGVVTATGSGWAQVTCLGPVPALGASVGESVTVDTTGASIFAEGQAVASLPAGCEAEFECDAAGAVFIHIGMSQMSGTVTAVGASSFSLTNVQVAGVAVADVTCSWSGTTSFFLSGAVSVTSSSLTVGTQVSVHASYAFAASQVNIGGEFLSLSLSSVTNITATSGGGCTFVAGGTTIILEATASVVLSVTGTNTCYTLTPAQFQQAVNNQTQGEIVIETDPNDPPGTKKGGKVHVKGNNGVGNGLDPQPPGNPPPNDGPGTGPGDPGNGP